MPRYIQASRCTTDTLPRIKQSINYTKARFDENIDPILLPPKLNDFQISFSAFSILTICHEKVQPSVVVEVYHGVTPAPEAFSDTNLPEAQTANIITRMLLLSNLGDFLENDCPARISQELYHDSKFQSNPRSHLQSLRFQVHVWAWVFTFFAVSFC